jgi:hypothetical protein
VRNIVLGSGVSIVIAFTAAVPSLGGVSTWKIALGLVGVVLFVLAGRER